MRDDKSTKTFEVTLTFNDGGECKLNVNGKERACQRQVEMSGFGVELERCSLEWE